MIYTKDTSKPLMYRKTKLLTDFAGTMRALAFSLDNSLLIVGMKLYTVGFYTKTWTKAFELKFGSGAVQFSPNGY